MSQATFPKKLTICQCLTCGTTELYPGSGENPLVYVGRSPCSPSCAPENLNVTFSLEKVDRARWLLDDAVHAQDKVLDAAKKKSPEATISTSQIVADHIALMKGRKHDNGKPRWDLLPWRAASEVVNVLTFGAQKYGDHNWQHVSGAKARYTSAAMRHLVAWINEDAKDTESGFHHLAHAATCLFFILETDLMLAADKESQS